MTDNEIIKALPKILYGGHGCIKCEYAVRKGDDRCGLKGCKIARDALDLINRQKAEIEKLNNENKVECLKNEIIGVVVKNDGFEVLDTDGNIDKLGTRYTYLTREEAEKALRERENHE